MESRGGSFDRRARSVSDSGSGESNAHALPTVPATRVGGLTAPRMAASGRNKPAGSIGPILWRSGQAQPKHPGASRRSLPCRFRRSVHARQTPSAVRLEIAGVARQRIADSGPNRCRHGAVPSASLLVGVAKRTHHFAPPRRNHCRQDGALKIAIASWSNPNAAAAAKITRARDKRRSMAGVLQARGGGSTSKRPGHWRSAVPCPLEVKIATTA